MNRKSKKKLKKNTKQRGEKENIVSKKFWDEKN